MNKRTLGRPEHRETDPVHDMTRRPAANIGASVAIRGQQRDGNAVAAVPDSLTWKEMSEGMLTEAMIQAVAGTQDLNSVGDLALTIDGTNMSVDGVWSSLPSLRSLVLDGSRLTSFRDLGTGLKHLHTLSFAASGLRDLDGIGALSGLRELRLERNNLSDVTPLACHANLRLLDLASNQIHTFSSLEIMATLPMLCRCMCCVGYVTGFAFSSNLLALGV